MTVKGATDRTTGYVAQPELLSRCEPTASRCPNSGSSQLKLQKRTQRREWMLGRSPVKGDGDQPAHPRSRCGYVISWTWPLPDQPLAWLSRNATMKPKEVTSPTVLPACSKPSGIIVSASMVRMAPAAKA
jgi:hypothetical protein